MPVISLLVGNSRVLLAVDERGDWRYLYHPYAGQYQHLLESRRMVFDVDQGRLTRVGDDAWEVRQGYEEGTDVAWSQATEEGLEVGTRDMVHPNRDLVLRQYWVRNLGGDPRQLRLFQYQSMSIAESIYQDTCYWDATPSAIVHYKRDTYLQLWGEPRFDGFTCGEHTLKGLQGSYVDARDGALDGNTISHGATDSVVQWDLDVQPGATTHVWLLLLLGSSRRRVNEAYRAIAREPVPYREQETANFWRAWFDGKRVVLPEEINGRAQALYERSLSVLRNCGNANGSVIASPDISSLMPTGDTYNYNWWRDGAYIATAMDRAGLYESAHRFLVFAQASQEEEGYFFHRHFPDGTPGATWHPPPFLQVDQTGSVLTAAWHHYMVHRDMEFLLQSWPMVKQAANFLLRFVDDTTGLPRPSWDLWEEREGVHCYSALTVAEGLGHAEAISQQLGKGPGAWGTAAAAMRDAILERFWDDDRGVFLRRVEPEDRTLDSSSLLALRCGVLAPDDPRAGRLVENLRARLWSPQVGGMARYEGDPYYGHENPWIICTLWLGDAYLRMGDPERATELVEWCVDRATPTLLLPEQVRAETGEPVSVVPLVWSHATYVETILNMLGGADVTP